MSVLEEVVEALGPALAAHARPDPGPGRYELADPGPDRFAALVEDPHRLFVLEAVYEGYLLHYGVSRAFEGMEPDLCLLAGDALYALGLERLAGAGDLEAVAELSDLISRSAQAHAEGRPGAAAQHWEASASKLAHSPPETAS